MAFSFRAGTNWCHDFPKLARESGFYFNMHTARVRVDWNRISSIDVERVIRERDFQTVDENVNNVIDYYLETEYDVKILDPNFVKLFRLAQLAVEYLLYCKQYLDQSVVILKEELKYKLEENVKLKEEITHLQDIIKEIKEKFKERNKATEIKSDIHGEIHKCPHCPKTFISASFANAHLVRRHSNLSECLQASSPAHEEYRAETEKLHNEIKTLKERLNQTERVIRSESNMMLSQSELTKIEKNTNLNEDANNTLHQEQYRRYQEEISNLKTMLFTEIRNIKRKESNLNQQENEQSHENIKELVSQQENEIQRLRNQLQEHLISNSNEIQNKLMEQENYWKSKIEQLENQHHNDVENLFTQLKLTQESSAHVKSEYEEKVSLLEKQALDQSKLLTAQSEQLSNLTKDLLDTQSKRNVDSNKKIQKHNKQKFESFTEDTIDSESSQSVTLSIKKVIQGKQSTSIKSNQSYNKLVANKKPEEMQKKKTCEEIVKESNYSKFKENKSDRNSVHKKIIENRNKYSSFEESQKSDTNSITESATETEEESGEETSETSVTRTESTNDEEPSETEKEIVKQKSHYKRRSSLPSVETVKQNLEDTFESKLRDLGIDPEWNGIPIVTFRQKMETIKHQQNIASKKFPKYEQIRRKLLEEISKKISIIQKSPKISNESEKKSFLNKAMKNVRTKALKALNEFKVQKSSDTSTPVISSKNSTPREFQPKHKLSLELLPRKPTPQIIQELKRQSRLELEKKQKKEEPAVKPRFSLHSEDNIQQQETVETAVEPSKRTKLLQRSYQSIEDFMRDIEEDSPKFNTANTKVTSTPSRNVKNLLQDTFLNDSDGQLTKQDSMWALASPKNSKSVLKSASGNASGLVKKKVLFDLEKKNSSESTAKSIGELLEEEQNEKKELNDSDWNISSISEEKETVQETVKEKNHIDNIQLKTSQSEKIAEISRKIQEKLEASRRKPAGSIEAMFSAKTFSSNNDNVEVIYNKQNSLDTINSAKEITIDQVEYKPQSNTNQVPRPAPRKQLFATKDSDLDMDIDDLLVVS